MSVWVAAWLFSFFCFVIALFGLKHAGAKPILAGLLATAFFPAPLFVAVATGNSSVFPFDFAVPLLVGIALKSKLRSYGWLYLLILSAGLVPFLNSFMYAPGSTDRLLAFVNLYRLIGAAAAAMVLASQLRPLSYKGMIDFGLLLSLFLFSLMVAQASGLVSTNLFESMWNTKAFLTYGDYADKKFVIMGLFKAAQGILWMQLFCLGTCAISTPHGRAIFLRGLAIVVLSALGLLLTGSKTSILAAGIIFVAAILITRSAKLVIPALASIVVVTLFINFALNSSFAKQYINSTLMNWIVSGGQNVQTLDSRRDTFERCLEIIYDQPLIVLGIFTKSVDRFNPSYFHNEYLSVFMLGGAAMFICYIVALTILAVRFHRNMPSNNFAVWALLTLLGGAVQGLSVNHTQPGFLFVTTVTFSFIIYGIGAQNAAAAPSARVPGNTDRTVRSVPSTAL